MAERKTRKVTSKKVRKVRKPKAGEIAQLEHLKRTWVYPESRVIAPGRDLRGHQRRSACVLSDE